MKLTYLKVRNLRALEDIEIEFGNVANIICGPNASGKSTIFEAIRLVRAVLAPRLQNEAQQVLIQMQALSQHYPQAGILLDSLTGDHGKPLIIEAHFKLDDSEIAQLPGAKQALATNLLQQQLANNQQNPLDMVSLLSTPQGQQMFSEAEKNVNDALTKVLAGKVCKLKLELRPHVGFVPDPDFIGPLIVATLERALPFNLALMSFFPADRALPPGEVNIQLGGPDAAQLLQSHSLVPQSKYARLKQTIVNSRVAPYPGGVDVGATFEKIFDTLLIGRKLEPIRVTPVGQVHIPIRDVKSNRVFDIDYLSSGEKGLILTLLLMVTSVAKHGIILIDEPELHLNPALCRRLLPFLIEECLVPFDRQAIICSHSPEILATAFDDARCSLFNLVSPRLVSPILSGDKDDLFVALDSLGASLDDILFSRGTVYVEGKDDEKILMEALAPELSKLKIVQMRGRGNVEKEIQNIQNLDANGKVDNSHYFIFDLDRKPTALEDTQHVRLLQWDQTSVDNFLLDANAIYDVVQDEEVNSGAPPKQRGDVQNFIKSLQDQQIMERSLSDAYQSFSYESPGLRSKEIRNKSHDEAAKTLSKRLSQIQEQTAQFKTADWEQELVEKAKARAMELSASWAVEGDKYCDAKRILEELHSEYKIRMPLIQFKRRIVRAMARRHAPKLEELKVQIRSLLEA